MKSKYIIYHLLDFSWALQGSFFGVAQVCEFHFCSVLRQVMRASEHLLHNTKFEHKHFPVPTSMHNFNDKIRFLPGPQSSSTSTHNEPSEWASFKAFSQLSGLASFAYL
jgi:hypothetical protein